MLLSVGGWVAKSGVEQCSIGTSPNGGNASRFHALEGITKIPSSDIFLDLIVVNTVCFPLLIFLLICFQTPFSAAQQNNNQKQLDSIPATDQSALNLRVPGFGPASGKNRVPSFGTAGKSAPEEQYAENIEEQIEDVLNRYDHNQDGMLDAEEIRDGNWGRPSPSASDTNGDGKLIRSELASRYMERENARKNYHSEPVELSLGVQNAIKMADQATISGLEQSQQERIWKGESQPRRGRADHTLQPKNAPRVNSDASVDVRYTKYAEALIKKYDSNGDGFLDSSESAHVKKLPSDTDADKNGLIDQSELALGLARKSTSSQNQATKENSRQQTYQRNLGVRSSSSVRKFSVLDTNQDNRVEMHEFSREWDSETVERYYEKDRNQDGVITPEEWSGK